MRWRFESYGGILRVLLGTTAEYEEVLTRAIETYTRNLSSLNTGGFDPWIPSDPDASHKLAKYVVNESSYTYVSRIYHTRYIAQRIWKKLAYAQRKIYLTQLAVELQFTGGAMRVAGPYQVLVADHLATKSGEYACYKMVEERVDGKPQYVLDSTSNTPRKYSAFDDAVTTSSDPLDTILEANKPDAKMYDPFLFSRSPPSPHFRLLVISKKVNFLQAPLSSTINRSTTL